MAPDLSGQNSMCVSRRTFGLFAVLLLAAFTCTAQEPADKEIVFRPGAGLLLHRSFSNITEKTEIIDDFSRITRSPTDSGNTIKPGFYLTAELLTGKSDKIKGAFAASLVWSSAAYHSSYTEEGRTSRPGFTHMERATELDHAERYLYLDVHAGVRSRLAEYFYLTGGLVLNKPLVANRESRGFVLTTYSAAGNPDTESTISYLNEDRKKIKGDANLSFRLRIEFMYQIGDNQGSLQLFRNFGMIYTLPWWGLGLTYTL